MGNVARGKAIEESWRNAGTVTDGNRTNYDWDTGFCDFPWPANLTIDLQDVHSVECIRFLLWDKDDRSYKYRLLTSVDHHQWQVFYISPEAGSRGWQCFKFQKPQECRFVRLHGLRNSHNESFQVVEFEVWNSKPDALDRPATLDEVIANVPEEEEREVLKLDVTEEFERLTAELDRLCKQNPFLNSQPLRLLVERLRGLATDVSTIERNMNAIKRHITEPVEKELKAASEESKVYGWYSVWGFRIGLLGGVLAIISMLVDLVPWHFLKGIFGR